jgi:hypothetical protein
MPGVAERSDRAENPRKSLFALELASQSQTESVARSAERTANETRLQDEGEYDKKRVACRWYSYRGTIDARRSKRCRTTSTKG